MNEPTSRNETRYRIARNIRIRGMNVTFPNEDTFKVETAFGGFTLTLMPHNRRVLISSDVFINPDSRCRGFGQRYLAIREEIAREAGINLLLATVRNDNRIEIHLLEKAGWKRFTNRTTGVSLWGKELE